MNHLKIVYLGSTSRCECRAHANNKIFVSYRVFLLHHVVEVVGYKVVEQCRIVDSVMSKVEVAVSDMAQGLHGIVYTYV